MVCVSCKTEHRIIRDKPVTVFFSDQNFAAYLEGMHGTCLTVVRMEDATLTELFDLSRKLFENMWLSEGSVFQIG
jgi:diadenosine tetraphosphate (Ap4A) HIT family hydrolase